MNKRTVVLAASSLLIGSLGFVGAQSSQSASAQTQSDQDAPQTQRGYGFGSGFGRGFGDGSGSDFGRGFGGLPFGRPLALGTTVTLEFYTADPAGDETSTPMPEQTLTFTYGEDSEATFAESFAEARANARYVTANVGEQTQTLELPSDTSDTSFGRGDRHGGVYGALPLRGLSEGSNVTATFYDGDPAKDAQTLQTLNFTYGQDSEAGFAADFADAAETAAYATVTTSPQTYTVDLSAVAEGRDFRQYRGGYRR